LKRFQDIKFGNLFYVQGLSKVFVEILYKRIV